MPGRSRRVAARQAELSRRRKQKGRQGPEAPPTVPAARRLPAPAVDGPETGVPERTQPQAAAPVPAPQSALSPVARGPRRERAAIAAQAAASLRSELLRIGAVALVAAVVLVGLKLGTNLGS